MTTFSEDTLRQIHTIDLRAYLTKRGYTVPKTGNIKCMFHDDDTPSFSMFIGNDGGHGWKCFGCNRTGDIIKWIEEKDGLTFPDAVKQICAEEHIIISENGHLSTPQVDQQRKFAVRPLARPKQKVTVSDLATWAASRNATPERYSNAGWKVAIIEGKPAIVIPHEDGIERARFFIGDIKYKPLAEKPKGKDGKAVCCLYGFERATKLADEANLDVLILTNGQSSVVDAQYFGLPAFAQTDGEKPTGLQEPLAKRVVAWLIAKPERALWIALDGDKAGRDMAKAVLTQFQRFNVVNIDFGGESGFDLGDLCNRQQGKSWALLRKLAAFAATEEQEEMPNVETDFDNSLVPKRGNCSPGIGLSFPYASIRAMGGFAELVTASKMALVIGTSGGGKTTFLDCCADDWLKKGYDVLYYSPEWTPMENHWRRIQRLGGATTSQFRRHNMYYQEEEYNIPKEHRYGQLLSEPLYQKSLAVNQLIKSWPGRLHPIKAQKTLEDALEVARKRLLILRREGRAPAVLMVDYVQMCTTSTQQDGRNVYEVMTWMLKQFSIQQAIHVMVAAQIPKNLKPSTENKPLGMYDAQWARPDEYNLVLTLNMQYVTNGVGALVPDYVPGTSKAKVLVNIAKNNDGNMGLVEMLFEGARLRYLDERWPRGTPLPNLRAEFSAKSEDK